MLWKSIPNETDALEVFDYMSVRVISGLTGAFFVFAVLFLNQSFLLLINILLAAISVLSITEIFSAMGISKMFWVTLPTLLFVPVMPVFGDGLLWQAAWYIYTLCMFGIMILNRHVEFKDVAIIYTMSMIITTSLSKIVQLRDYGGNYGSFYVLLALGVAWTSDTGAYFCGKYLGRHKLCPDVSPKKTIEGVIGGTLICIASMVLIGFLFNNFIFTEKIHINYLSLILFGLIGSPLSALGDLCFSVIKRSCHVKDFGNVIPGHGGILDRFDSVIFVAPFAFLFIRTIPIIL